MTTLLRRYRAERLPLPLTCAVPLLLAAAAQTGRPPSFGAAAADALLAFLLFAQFRILDDLADRAHDASVHPQRVLVRAQSVWPVACAALLLGAGTILMLLGRDAAGPALVAWLMLLAFLSACYGLRRRPTLLGGHLLLTKYPVFVWIIAASAAGRLPWAQSGSTISPVALPMLATYLGACLYEALHDGASAAAARPGLVAAEGVLLALTLLVLSVGGAS
jgi:4-hydroxybenzoate polyprenyltransferase